VLSKRLLLLLIDSPGGGVPGISAFAETVAAGNKMKPTSAHVSGMAAYCCDSGIATKRGN
jgi:ClpP class serine protease